MLLHGFHAALFAQRHRFALWVPVWLGVGISIYFAIRFEPDFNLILSVLGICLCLVLVTNLLPETLRVLVWVPIFIAFGFLLAVARSHAVDAPKLGWHYYGPIEGTISHLDRSTSDKPRVTLIHPTLSKISAARTPDRIRVALHSKIAGTPLTPGARIMVTGSLSAPAGPVEPGGFDFQRKAWFDGLGAVGYSRNPPMLAEPANPNTFKLRLFAFRMWMSGHIQKQVEGQSGAFAAAIITGDRSQIDPNLLTDLRQSNLAHLLAISGLHMGLLTGFIFGFVRFGIAAIPVLAVRWQAKKIGAVIALVAGLAYLMISGANIATQRAFVMVAVMLIAILLDRPAITLRAVAIAATIILVARPESLTQPGFQMSFAATTALVATFEALNKSPMWHGLNRGRFRFLSPVFSLVIASAIAGVATAPFSAFHFNQTAQYGLLANLLSVPVMGVLVMPAAVIAAVLSMIGLQGPAFWVMGKGIEWILGVANFVSGLEGAVIRFASTSSAILGLFTFGALVLILIQGRGRLVGIGLSAIALGLWSQSDRPQMLITDNGRMVGIETGKGRALSRDKGNGFAAKTWLENDGDGAIQSAAAARMAFDKSQWRYDIVGQSVYYVWSKSPDPEVLRTACVEHALLISPQIKDRVEGPCHQVNQISLRDGGAVAVWATPQGLKLQSAKDVSGHRIWNE